MRFAGTALKTNPASVGKVSNIIAGQRPAQNPGLVEEITQAITPKLQEYQRGQA
jgi:hypothetical protein